MELEITSLKYGKFIVYYDEQDHELIQSYNWYPSVSRKGKIYVKAGVYDKETQNTKTLLMHCLIMGKKGIDHIDHNGLNNTRSNLREATQRQNAKNQTINILNKFGVKGVTFDKRKKVYCVYITNDYRHIYLGQYHSLVEAAIAYNEAAIRYHGEFASINLINPEIEKELKKYDLKPRVCRINALNTSGYRGVGKMKTGKYYAKIIVNKKQIHIGSYDNKKDAAIAYNTAAVQYYGVKALLNEVI